jgi:superfamily II DNA helicase RecQ
MQIKVISVPVSGGDSMNEELNKFLRGHKVVQVEQQLITDTSGAYWTFCIRYVEGGPAVGSGERKERIDYRELLPPEVFAKFARLRVARKSIAEGEGIPAFAVFTDAELAEMARLDELTKSSMQQVKGVGEKKAEKYAAQLIKAMQQDETSQ